MYKHLLKLLDDLYDELIRIQYLLNHREKRVKNNPDVELYLQSLEESRNDKKRKIRNIRSHIKELEKIVDKLEE